MNRWFSRRFTIKQLMKP